MKLPALSAVCFCACLLVTAAGSVHAAPITVNFDAGTLHTTDSLTGSATSGDDMVGMSVKATFVGGGIETLNWAATGSGAGGVSGTGWSLGVSGDTFSADWALTNTSASAIRSILIDGQPGNTLFDTNFGGSFGTTGSAFGNTFDEQSSTSFDVTATYSDELALTGDSPVGDLWTRLNINFNDSAGFTSGNTFTFEADTDSAVASSGINSAVPEPSSLALLAMGAAGLIGYGRRRNRAQQAA